LRQSRSSLTRERSAKPRVFFEDAVPGFPHGLKQAGRVPFGDGAVGQFGVVGQVAQGMGSYFAAADAVLDLAFYEGAEALPQQFHAFAESFVVGQCHSLSL
jgi:hypothetical protein